MIENLDNVFSLVVIVALLVGGLYGFMMMSRNIKSDEADDYFRDLF